MRSRRGIAAVLAVAVASLPSTAAASFHLASISEIGVGIGGDPSAQFVELRLDAPGQTLLTNTRLTAFDAAGNATELLVLDRNVSNGASGANVLLATSALLARTTIAADFVIPAGLATPAGMICWGAPGAVPPDPEDWDLEKPNNYVDCVAYGGYTGPTRLASGTPTTLPPGDATRALARTDGTGAAGSNDVDFALATPAVCNNAGDCTDLAGEPNGNPCGDADGSGAVTVTDGVQTLRAAAGLSSPCTLATCDVDASGAITVTDGVQVLRGAAGLPLDGGCGAGG